MPILTAVKTKFDLDQLEREDREGAFLTERTIHIATNIETIPVLDKHDSESSVPGLLIGRVSVDPKIGICPTTGVKLHLLDLTSQQRQQVRETLLDMAETMREEYAMKLQARKLAKAKKRKQR